MNDYNALYDSLITYWNAYAAANGFEPVGRTNDKIRKVIKRRMRAEKDFVARLPYYLDIIQKHCGGTDEFGKPLTLRSALRTTTTLRALRAELGI